MRLGTAHELHRVPSQARVGSWALDQERGPCTKAPGAAILVEGGFRVMLPELAKKGQSPSRDSAPDYLCAKPSP